MIFRVCVANIVISFSKRFVREFGYFICFELLTCVIGFRTDLVFKVEIGLVFISCKLFQSKRRLTSPSSQSVILHGRNSQVVWWYQVSFGFLPANNGCLFPTFIMCCKLLLPTATVGESPSTQNRISGHTCVFSTSLNATIDMYTKLQSTSMGFLLQPQHRCIYLSITLDYALILRRQTEIASGHGRRRLLALRILSSGIHGCFSHVLCRIYTTGVRPVLTYGHPSCLTLLIITWTTFPHRTPSSPHRSPYSYLHLKSTTALQVLNFSSSSEFPCKA